MRVLTTVLATAGLAAIAAAASAQQEATFLPGGVFALSPQERFASTDTNKDGKITADEMKAVLNPDAQPFISAIMERADTNNDGWLSQSEFAPQPAAGGRFGRGAAGRGGAAPAAPAPKGK